MLYHLLYPLAGDIPAFNVFRYITFRSGGAVLTALFICLIFGPRIIDWLRSKQGKGQPIREDGPASHIVTKQGTPTMGGFLILIGMAVGTLLWCDLSNKYVWISLFVTVGFGGVGFIDDYLKVTRRSSKGSSPSRGSPVSRSACCRRPTWPTRWPCPSPSMCWSISASGASCRSPCW